MLGDGYTEINKTVVSEKIFCPNCKKEVHFLSDKITCPICERDFQCKEVSIYMTSINIEPVSGWLQTKSSFIAELIKKLLS